MTELALSPDFAPGLLAESAAARVTLIAPVARFSLRCKPASRATLARVLDLPLPETIGHRAHARSREALRLGPDEWVLTALEGDAAGIAADCAAAYDAAPHSLVELSDREVTFAIDGPGACDLLSLSLPRDLDGIGVGQGRRTVFDGQGVVLWRDEAHSFRMDVWRSFAPHVASLLATGCRELALEM
ncbi:sarcosine oxidase subunit gamma [Roseivivax lentus]|uniref:Sarcosine oxidase subunit gamma n=1 Tax=Roseivivax lentus TaxID=633194 RepID=A0A1N7LQE1_9RHOB|nr:sarcosine oxidase subunit gamma [Roseivivax lentus]SIS76073.1 sarcosine oxidase subunit gamma [Roseivivax lentus]